MRTVSPVEQEFRRLNGLGQQRVTVRAREGTRGRTLGGLVAGDAIFCGRPKGVSGSVPVQTGEERESPLSSLAHTHAQTRCRDRGCCSSEQGAQSGRATPTQSLPSPSEGQSHLLALISISSS